jgi:sugar (pentulose or hexulose) kinase
MKTVIGIDLGTQSLKAVFYDYAAREIVAAESAELDLYQNDEGAAEQQAHWWLNALHDVLGKMDSAILGSAVAVGVSGQQHGFVPLGRTGEVLAPVKLWCDTSTVADCDEIMEAYGGAQKCLDEVGNLILPGYTASKVRWFARESEGRYEQLDCILLPHDYLNFYLTGERCMEAGDASGTGFLDIRDRDWSGRMLAAIDPGRNLRDCLPHLRTGPEVIGQIRPEVAKRTGLPAGIPVSTGGGDNMMAAIGTGNVSPGKLTMSLGTSGTVYAWPFFNGERTPNLPRAKACVMGLDSQNSRPENLLRSALEGATFALRYGVERLSELGIEASEIMLTGGGVGSATWRQVVADMCAAPVTVLEQDEGASFGAALQALSVLDGGGQGDIRQLAEDHLSRNEALCCEPKKSAVNFYNEAYLAYRDCVRAVTPLYA